MLQNSDIRHKGTGFMKKRIVSVFICLIITVLILPMSASASGGGVSVSKLAVYRGDTFAVTLSVPAMTEKITDASFKVKFDKSVFEVTSYTAPDIAKADKMQSNVSESNANGFFSVTYNSISCDPDVTFGTYSLSCTFKVKSSAAYGKYNFEVSNLSVGSVTDDGMPVLLYGINDCPQKTASVTVSEKKTEQSSSSTADSGNTESKPTESKPTETSKPTESKPSESKPTESKQTETSKTTVSDNTESKTEPIQSTEQTGKKAVTETSAEPTESQIKDAEKESNTEEQKNRKSLLWLYILIPVMLILAVIGICIYLKFFRNP